MARHDSRIRVSQIELCFGSNVLLGSRRGLTLHFLAVGFLDPLSIAERFLVLSLLLPRLPRYLISSDTFLPPVL